MATILRSLRYIKNFGGTSGRVLFNQRKNVINSIIRCNNGMLAVLESKERWPNPSVNSKKEFIEHKIRNIEESIKIRNRVWKNEILAIMNKIQSPDDITSLQALLLLRCCGSVIVEHLPTERVKLVKDLWNVLNSYNVPMDVFHYNALIQVHLENDYDFSPTQLLMDMNKRGIKPNKVTYNRLIQYYCKQGCISEATKVLECMREEGQPITENIFNSLIIGHSQAGDMENALKILDIMKENKIMMTANTYTALMCAYAKLNDIEKIEEIIATCESENVYLSYKHIFNVMHSMVVNHHTEHIDKMLQYVNGSVKRHEVVHFALNLVNIDQVDLSMKILEENVLSTINNDALYEQVTQLFLMKLVNSNVKAEKIIEICDYFKSKQIANNLLLSAVYYSFPKHDEELSLTLLRACRKMHYTIRPHFFWPILVDRGLKNDFQGILDILNCMIKDFNIIPCIHTIKDFIIPNTFGRTSDIRNLLTQYQVPNVLINNAMVYSFLKKYKTRNAVQYMKMFPDTYWYNVLGNVLRKAVCSTVDIKSFVYISRQLSQKTEANTGISGDDSTQRMTSFISMEEQLLDFINDVPQRKFVFAKILVYLAEIEEALSNEAATALLEYMGDGIQPEVKTALEEMSRRIPLTDNTELTATMLLNKIKERQAKNLPVDELEDKLINTLSDRMVDTTKTEPLSRDLYVFLIGYFCRTRNLAFAERYMQEFENIYYRCDDSLLNLEYATLLLREQKYKTACEYLMKNAALAVTKESQNLSETVIFSVSRMHKSISAEQLEQLVRVLVTSKYMVPAAESITRVINAHIREKNLPAAVKFFCSMTNQNKIMNSAKHNLTKALIRAEEHTLLQELIDHCSMLQSKSVVLIDLFFDFIECNKMKQAMKVLEMKEIHTSMPRMWNQIGRYIEKREEKKLEKFLEATEHVGIIYRVNVYENLLQIYAYKNDWKSGLNLWTKMQEENILPNTNVLSTLGNLLEANGQPVPFVYEKQESPKKETPVVEKEWLKSSKNQVNITT